MRLGACRCARWLDETWLGEALALFWCEWLLCCVRLLGYDEGVRRNAVSRGVVEEWHAIWHTAIVEEWHDVVARDGLMAVGFEESREEDVIRVIGKRK